MQITNTTHNQPSIYNNALHMYLLRTYLVKTLVIIKIPKPDMNQIETRHKEMKKIEPLNNGNRFCLANCSTNFKSSNHKHIGA